MRNNLISILTLPCGISSLTCSVQPSSVTHLHPISPPRFCILPCPLWSSLPFCCHGRLWNLQSLTGHYGNPLKSIQVKCIYSGEPDPLKNELPTKVRWIFFILAYFFFLTVSTLYLQWFLLVILVSDVLFKAGAILCIFVLNRQHWKRGLYEYIQRKGSQLFKGVISKVTAVSEGHSDLCLPVPFMKM